MPDWSCEAALRNMGDTAGEISLAAGNDIILATLRDPGSKNHLRREIELVRDRRGQRRSGFQQRRSIFQTQYLPRLVAVEQCPEAAIDADLPPLLHPMIDHQPAAVGEDRLAASAKLRRKARALTRPQKGPV